MPVKTTKSKKITVGELSAILQDNPADIQPVVNEEKMSSALDRIKARTKKSSKEDKKENTEEDIKEKPAKRKTVKEKADKTKTEKESVSEEKLPETKPKKTGRTKKTADTEETEVKAEEKPKRAAKTKKTSKSAAAEKPKKSEKADGTEKDEANEKKKAKTVAKDVIKEKLSSKKTVKKTGKTNIKSIIKDENPDITLGELLEQAEIQEELKDNKDNVKRLKNITATIRADTSKRRKRKNDAAIVMATLTGNTDAIYQEEEKDAPVKPGFPVDVSGIDFEKERYDAEQECIDDFKAIVAELSLMYATVDLEFGRIKDEIIGKLSALDEETETQTKELKMKQSDLVNKIAEIQEVILSKKTELSNLGFMSFYKKGQIKQIISESEIEISQLEMDALSYNSKLIAIIDEAAKKRKLLFREIETAKSGSEQAKRKLDEAQSILDKMENREQIDENAVHKKLILNALRLYPKPMTIGQLLYYPGLSGYSVQRMSSAINQLVNNDKLVLKVALEDNVYYLIADNKED